MTNWKAEARKEVEEMCLFDLRREIRVTKREIDEHKDYLRDLEEALVFAKQTYTIKKGTSTRCKT